MIASTETTKDSARLNLTQIEGRESKDFLFLFCNHLEQGGFVEYRKSDDLGYIWIWTWLIGTDLSDIEAIIKPWVILRSSLSKLFKSDSIH
jgi:hypothetical protein